MPRLSPPSLAQFDYGPISGLIPHLNYTARSGEQAGPERFLSFSPNRIGNIASVDVYVAPMPGAERSTGTVGLLSLTPGDTPPSNPADHHNLAVDAGTVGRLSGLTRRRLPPLPLLAAHLSNKRRGSWWAAPAMWVRADSGDTRRRETGPVSAA